MIIILSLLLKIILLSIIGFQSLKNRKWQLHNKLDKTAFYLTIVYILSQVDMLIKISNKGFVHKPEDIYLFLLLDTLTILLLHLHSKKKTTT